MASAMACKPTGCGLSVTADRVGEQMVLVDWSDGARAGQRRRGAGPQAPAGSGGTGGLMATAWHWRSRADRDARCQLSRRVRRSIGGMSAYCLWQPKSW